jgi:hypothetical protein
MTDETPTPAPTLNIDDWLIKDRARTALCETLRPGNKTALFDAFAAAGITSVLVHFDGYGDSGQIEDIDVVAGDQPSTLPTVEVELASIAFDSDAIDRNTLTVHQAIENQVYDLLRQTHCGWENNEGAYGDFTFNVAERTITLDYNERVASSEYTQHVF